MDTKFRTEADGLGRGSLQSIKRWFLDLDIMKGAEILVGIGGIVYCGFMIHKGIRETRLAGETYQELPAAIRKYDDNPRDGYLSPEELKRYFADSPLTPR